MLVKDGTEVVGGVTGFFDQLVVHETGLTKVRIGNEHDGGYVLLGEVSHEAHALYSFGIGDDVGFEKDLVGKFPWIRKIFLYDPDVKELSSIEGAQSAFYRQCLGRGCGKLVSVEQDAILKMDIEWDEWRAIKEFDGAELRKFSQIVVELHIICPDSLLDERFTPYFQKFYAEASPKINDVIFDFYSVALRKLLGSFYIYHIHANNSLPKIQRNGFIFPPLLELSLVRRDLVSASRYEGTFPVQGLDSPNKTDRPDILGYYPFKETEA